MKAADDDGDDGEEQFMERHKAARDSKGIKLIQKLEEDNHRKELMF